MCGTLIMTLSFNSDTACLEGIFDCMFVHGKWINSRSGRSYSNDTNEAFTGDTAGN